MQRRPTRQATPERPQPPAPTAPAPPDPACRQCFGEGYVKMQTGDRLGDWWPVPCRCRRRSEGGSPAPR